MKLAKTLLLELIIFLLISVVCKIMLTFGESATVRFDVWIMLLYVLYPIAFITICLLLIKNNTPVTVSIFVCASLVVYLCVSLTFVFGGNALFDYSGKFIFGPYLLIAFAVSVAMTLGVCYIKGKRRSE